VSPPTGEPTGARRVLVTGASGFIGRNALPALLAAHYEVHAVSRREDPGLAELAPGVRWHAADLLDEQAIARLLSAVAPTHLLHLAWFSEHGAFWHSPENLSWLGASLHLLRAFEVSGGRRAVVAGTCAEYDWSIAGRCLEGVTPLAPATLYGTCKHALRQVAESLWDAPDAPALAWGRVFFLYGPHENQARLVPSVIAPLLAGEAARCSHGRQERDFLHVADVAGAFVALLSSEVRGAVNIGSGESVSIAELVRLLGALCGRPELVRLGVLPARAGEPEELLADTGRLREEVGFSPSLTLEEGLNDTVAWWRGVSGQLA
jgi:nucleoside-diphosphate-sugar epimerase